jgi:S-adenosylmethionine-dependent methyltransferase
MTNGVVERADRDRFQSEADKYAAYLDTPEVQLRRDLPFANLREFLQLPQAESPLRALDVGCGTGANGLRLAQFGFHVTLLDSSPAMLEIARSAARKAGVTEKIEIKQVGADQLSNLFDPGSFDVVLCHNVLEFVEDPGIVLRGTARALRDSSGILSLLVRNRAGEVFKAAILSGDLALAEQSLDAECGNEALYGGSVRLFTPHTTRTMLKAATLSVRAERGERVLTDYLSPRVSLTADYDRVFQLERKLGSRPEFAAIARYTHYLARPECPAIKDHA